MIEELMHRSRVYAHGVSEPRCVVEVVRRETLLAEGFLVLVTRGPVASRVDRKTWPEALAEAARIVAEESEVARVVYGECVVHTEAR